MKLYMTEVEFSRDSRDFDGPREVKVTAFGSLGLTTRTMVAEAHLSRTPLVLETIPGARSVYACTEHDDCREHPEVGVACYRERCKEEKR